MMITGDYHYTAIAVARDVGMVKPGGQVLIIETNGLSLLRSAMQSPLSAANTMAESKFTPHVSFARLSSNRAGHWGSAHDVDADEQRISVAGAKQAGSQQLSNRYGLLARPATSTYAPLSVPEQFAASSDCSPSPVSLRDLSISTPEAPLEIPWEGLKFTTAAHEALDTPRAIAALAEGQMQCAVTGDAFQYLLQQCDLSLLETVMRNAVVFSRMQPHQKGQVMDLLGMSGIHQLFDGQTRFVQVPF